MALTIQRGYTASSGETWTPTKQNNSTVPVITVATGTLVGRSTAGTGNIEEILLGDGLAIVGGSITLGWRDTNATHRMRIACGSDLTADRTITIAPGDANRTLTLTGNATLNQDVSTTGSPTFANLTVSGAISGTVVAAAGTLTGTTLAANVVNASLNSITAAGGTLNATGNMTVMGATSLRGGNLSLIVGADNSANTLTNATEKVSRIGTPHYLLAEEPAALLVCSTTVSANLMSIGGGTALMNAVTNINFITASNNVTPTGTIRMSINSAGHVSIPTGHLGIGGSASVSSTILSQGAVTGGTDAREIFLTGQIQSDVTNLFVGVQTFVSTAAASFTLGNIVHFSAGQNTLGSGSAVTAQSGFIASSNLIGASANFGFRGQIPAGSNRYNLYMEGTAVNYLAGNTCIGTGPSATARLAIAASTTGIAPLDIGQGTAPTSPTNGMIWITSSGVFARVNGVTQQFAVAGPAAAGTLTGATLAANVINSSLNNITPTGGDLAVTGSITVSSNLILNNITPTGGNLAVAGSITVSSDLIQTGTYHNFTATQGAGGYGFRNNSGVMEFKNNGGGWAPFGTGGGSGTVTSVSVSGANGINSTGSPITGSGNIALSLGNITPTSVASGGPVSGTTADFSTEYRVAGLKVIGPRGSALSMFSPTGTYSTDQGQIAGCINGIIGRLQSHGLIA